MLNRDNLIKRLTESFEAGKPRAGALQAERKRLHELPLEKLGKEFEAAFPKEDPHALKSAA